MTLREKVITLGRRRKVRGVTVSDVIRTTNASRSTASAALTETLKRTTQKRKGRAGRLNSVYTLA